MALAAFAVEAFACTSAIVSGKLTANGRPLLWKIATPTTRTIG